MLDNLSDPSTQAIADPICGDQVANDSLIDLAVRIRSEHAAAAAAFAQSVAHAIAAGQLLIEAKRELKRLQGARARLLKQKSKLSDRGKLADLNQAVRAAISNPGLRAGENAPAAGR